MERKATMFRVIAEKTAKLAGEQKQQELRELSSTEILAVAGGRKEVGIIGPVVM